MKTLLAALSATLAMTGAAQAQTFEFRGETTSTPVDMTTKTGCNTVDGVAYCAQITELAGVSGVIYTASYYQGGLNGLLGQFDGDRYLTMLRSFTEKYGAPKMSETEWRNRAGAVLSNTVATWTFEDGTLTLSSIGHRVTDGAFEFITTANQPPSTPAKVDF